MIPREPGCYILNHIPSGTFYIGSTSNLLLRERNLLASLNNHNNHNPRLQELYWESTNVVFEYVVTADREEAYDLEQAELDKWLGHSRCLNVNNDARSVWAKGTMPEHRARSLTGRNTEIHSDKKYRLGHHNSTEQRMRQSDSIKASWANRERLKAVPRPVSVEGVRYNHAGEAAAALGYSRRTIVVRARTDDERYTNWLYCD